MTSRSAVCVFAFASLVTFSAAAQDVVTVGSATTSASTVDIPLSIRDTSGTPLGIDRPAGSRIQSYSIKVDYAPASAVSSVTFSRAGITAGLTPTSEFTPSSTGAVSLLDTFKESTNLIPFTLNAMTPGDKVAHLVFNLSASATPGTTITLTLDPALTQLTDEGGSAATKETQANGGISLVNGAINVAPLSIVLAPSPLTAELHSISAGMTATISAAVGSVTNVTLSSSSPNVAAVPSSVIIPAGSTSASFFIDPLLIGQSTITATLPPATGGATTQASVDVVGPRISFSPLQQTANAGAAAAFTLTISTPQPSDVTIALASSDTTVATVSSSVVIAAGQRTATVNAAALKSGTTNIQATLAQSLGGGTGNATLNVVVGCVTPGAPSISAPAEAASGSAYNVGWAQVSGATEYLIDEATDSNFGGATTRTVTTLNATFTHTVLSDTRYYYRVRVHNKSGTCDVVSASSTPLSVLVKFSAAPVMQILPVVGSAAGAFGSFFKTSLQLYNAKSITITGKIVYHAGGSSGSASDPSLIYALAPGKTITYDDLLGAFSKSGVGSADIIADLNSPLPVSVARVFNDAGAGGTSGFGEEAMPPEDALQSGESGVLIAPVDFTRFRLNIGIRTLDQSATMTITARDKDGIVLRTVEKAFDPTFFTQTGASGLLEGLALTGGETITFTMTSGTAIVYGSMTDNTTNDPTLQIAHKSN